jgi:trimethylamine--corrinoid protein Co-methyltransferase
LAWHQPDADGRFDRSGYPARLIVLQNIEILAPLVLSQLASPGAPAIYGILATVADMKTAVASTAAPEVGVVMHACTQMAKTYRMPSRADVGLSDSCIVDYQSGAETAFQMLLKQAARKTPMHRPIER